MKTSLFLFTFSKYRIYTGILLYSKYVHAYILVKEICLQKIISKIPICLMNKNNRSNDFTLFSVLCKRHKNWQAMALHFSECLCLKLK